ncbi:phage baseplate protein [Pseudomonas parakoreensis]
MSIVNIFTRQAPTLASYSFDAVLEDTFEASVSITTFPIESGVRVADHRIFNPFKWTMTGAISNNPVKVQLTDFLGGRFPILPTIRLWRELPAFRLDFSQVATRLGLALR